MSLPDLNKEDLQAIRRLLEPGFPAREPGDYCCLADESKPEGLVEFRRANGHAYMMMPRETFEQLRTLDLDALDRVPR